MSKTPRYDQIMAKLAAQEDSWSPSLGDTMSEYGSQLADVPSDVYGAYKGTAGATGNWLRSWGPGDAWDAIKGGAGKVVNAPIEASKAVYEGVVDPWRDHSPGMMRKALDTVKDYAGKARNWAEEKGPTGMRHGTEVGVGTAGLLGAILLYNMLKKSKKPARA